MRMARHAATGIGLAAAGYAALVTTAWLRFGRVPPPRPDEVDPWLDRLMPSPDVVERHHVRVAALASLTLSAACDVDFDASPAIRAIVRTRELLLGARADATPRPHGLLAAMQSIGWGVLADQAGREIVLGAVTQPWLPDVVFRPLPADAFSRFDEPGFVAIAWTLRVDPIDAGACVFRTETRARATDADARRRFRWYWARFSPGIVVIRHEALRLVRAEAERRAQASAIPAPAG